MNYLALFFLLFLLSGCGCTHPYPPCCTYEVDGLPVYSYDDAAQAGAVVDAGTTCWWETFNDPQLESLMGQAIAMNPGISYLESKVREAYGEVNMAKSHLYPWLDLFGDFEFTQITRTGYFPVIREFPFEFGLWTLQTNLYWDLDIWNKNKDRVQKYLGIERSAILDANWGAFILSLSVAENYFKWLISAEQLSIQQEIVCKQEKLLQLVEKSIAHNLSNASDFIYQKVQLEQAEEQLNNIKSSMEIYEHALKALVGDFCIPLQLRPICFEKLVPFQLPKCLTLDVISRRIDIQSQIWLIESARYDIDIAQKQFYPDIDLTAFFGFSTIHFQKWFNSASTNWMIDPAVHLPIFHGGALCANLLISREKFLQEVETYNQMVLEAAQELLDGFSNLKKSEANFVKIDNEIELIGQDIELEKMRVKHNLSTANSVLQKEIGQLAVQLRQTESAEQIIGSILSIVRSTGGGYE